MPHFSIFQNAKKVHPSMETTTSSSGRYYRPELDVLRFFAFLLVFLHHTLPDHSNQVADHLLKGFTPAFYAFVNACGFGLSLFFTLSAFLICELLLRERATVGTVAVKQFYIRRILRIWPLYYLGLALGVLVALLPAGNPTDVVRIGWFAIFLGAWNASHQGWVYNPISSLWSISVEEQFYLFAPWTVKYFNRKSLYGFCAMLILSANIWLYYLGSVRAPDYRIWYDFFVQFECFAAGILLCLILHGRVPRISIWKRLALIASCFSCWMFASYGLHSRFFSASENPGSWPLIGGYALAALGSVMLLAAFLGIDPRLFPRWAIYMGRISFGLYVYHRFAIYTRDNLSIDSLLSIKAIPNY
jgi:peptidoglycan/LPS O-acetylase OafA/YrhL